MKHNRLIPMLLCAALFFLTACNNSSISDNAQSTISPSLDAESSLSVDPSSNDEDFEGTLEAGDIALISSSATLEDCTDIDLGYICEYSFVVQNNSGYSLTSIAVRCMILDAEGNILGTEESWLDADIANGVKATVTGSFFCSDYPDAATIQAFSGYYDGNGDLNVTSIDFLSEEAVSTAIDIQALKEDIDGASSDKSDDETTLDEDAISDEETITEETSFDNRDIEAVMDRLSSIADSDSVKITGPIEVDNGIGYGVQYNERSVFYVLCNPDNDGKMVIGIIPETLDSEDGLADCLGFYALMTWSVDDSISALTAYSYMWSAYEDSSCTENGITYSFTDSLAYLISY